MSGSTPSRASDSVPPPVFRLVDVFAERRYAGNQLAVVHDPADGSEESDGVGPTAALDDETMQAVASEFGFSETTFVEGWRRDGTEIVADVRIFTPNEEIPFAGHPTLGTAAVLRDLADGRPERVVLDLRDDEVPVWVESDAGGRGGGDESNGTGTLWMRQRAPEFGPDLDGSDLARVFGLDPMDLDPDHPVRVVSTGLPTVVVPLTDRAALERIEVNRPAYDGVTGDRDAKNVLAFCADPREERNDLAVRVFAPYYGVPEDPATGSSNGCLAAYLVKQAYFGSDGGSGVDVAVEQGVGMGRPSRLHLRAERASDGEARGSGEVAVEVGGRIVSVAEGRLR